MRLNKKEIIKAKVYRKLQLCKVAVNMFFLCFFLFYSLITSIVIKNGQNIDCLMQNKKNTIYVI